MSQPEIFVIKNDREQGIFLLDEDTGWFAGETSLGTFSYVWPFSWRECSLKEFIATSDFDYFTKKAFKGKRKCFDHDASVKFAHTMIIERRKDGCLDPQTARKVWDAILKTDGYDERSFLDSIRDLPGIQKALGSDWYEVAVESLSPQLRRFEKVLWPLLKAKLCETECRPLCETMAP